MQQKTCLATIDMPLRRVLGVIFFVRADFFCDFITNKKSPLFSSVLYNRIAEGQLIHGVDYVGRRCTQRHIEKMFLIQQLGARTKFQKLIFFCAWDYMLGFAIIRRHQAKFG